MVYVPREILSIILKHRKLLIWNEKFNGFKFPKMLRTFGIRNFVEWTFTSNLPNIHAGVSSCNGIINNRWCEWILNHRDVFEIDNFNNVQILGIMYDVVTLFGDNVESDGDTEDDDVSDGGSNYSDMSDLSDVLYSEIRVPCQEVYKVRGYY